MQYLKIENRGTSPIECFTTLGISTSRYSANENTIGTFGSGSKHACLLLMRQEINPIIFCGKLSLEWYSKPAPIKAGSVEQEFNLVYYRVKGRTEDGTINREERTSYTLEYGVSDWDETHMALREFVSNALDRAADEYYTETGKVDHSYIKLCKVEVVDENQVRAKDGFTRVFVPLTTGVEEFYKTLGKRFLHFSQPHLLNTVVLAKAGRNMNPSEDGSGRACIYKKGVFIREAFGQDSVYDYNFGAELNLDESRNLDDYAVQSAVGRKLRDADPVILKRVFEKMNEGVRVWESELYGLRTDYNDTPEVVTKRAARWTEAIKMATRSDAAVLCTNNETVQALVKRKGKKPVVVRDCWLQAATQLGVVTDSVILSKEEAKGTTFSEPTPAVLETFEEIWDLLDSIDMLSDSTKPPLSCFTELSTAEATRAGFYDPVTSTININTDRSGAQTDDLWMTMLEEISHHVTGADDNSRDFQNYFKRVILKLAHQQRV